MKVTFPHIGNIYIFMKVMFDTLGAEYLVPPPCTKHTLELGSKYAPEMACQPLKITLGSFIESIEKGAETVVITGGNGPCRFGYYGEMHKELLRSMGYDKVKVIVIDPSSGARETIRRLREVFGAGPVRIALAFRKAFAVITLADELDRLCCLTRAEEAIRGDTDAALREFKRQIDNVKGYRTVRRLIEAAMDKVRQIPLEGSRKPLKIGLVGDIYTLIEPLANMHIEETLGQMGIIADKSQYISRWIGEHMLKKDSMSRKKRQFDRASLPYLPMPIGGFARESVGHSALYGREGYDGVIQIYPLTCTPEIVASCILPAVAEESDIPVLTLVLDEMTGEAGYRTRIDAFADMLMKKREANTNGKVLSRN